MNKQNIIKIFTLLIITIFVLSSSKTAEQLFKPTWYNYIKGPNTNFIISNPLNKVQIHFDILQKNIKTNNIQIHPNGLWRANYSNTQNLKINFYGKQEKGLIYLQSNTQKINFTIKNVKDYKITLSYNNFFVLIKDSCQKIQNSDNFNCNISSSKVTLFLNGQYEQIIKLQAQALHNNNIQIIQKFINKQQIIKINNFTHLFVQDMLTATLSSICIQDSYYEGYKFYGLCSNKKSKQIQRHFSLLVLQILFSYNRELSMWLVENYLNLLEEKLFYSFQKEEWIPIPQHTQVFKIYLKNLYEIQNISTYQKEKRKNLVIQVQNGMLNKLLLSEVNHLSQQINYRETKKVHPTLMKMLTQAWKFDNIRAKVSSIYSQSFTSDFYYHSKNQKLDSTVGKMAWLIKLLNQHIYVIQKYGDTIQKQSLEQLFSLSKVLVGYTLDQTRAKQGNFNSIIVQQKIRVYTRSLGYESLLPFIYQISPVFPINTILNLTTQNGITSLQPNHQKVDERYQFRGNINLYFNYKILFSMLNQNLQKPKMKMFKQGIIVIIQSIQKKIYQTYQTNKKQGIQKYYTTWNVKGQGKKSEKYLAIINTVFMKDLKKIKNAGKTKKIEQKQK